jgi:hypothetical protein
MSGPPARPLLATGDEIEQRLHNERIQNLLAAHDALYDAARWRHRGRVAFGIALAAAAPVAVIYFNVLQAPLEVFTAIGIVAAILLDQSESTLTTDGANVLEEFDTELYGLRWNELLVGKHPRPELVRRARASFHGDPAQMVLGWYPSVKGLPAIYAQLVIQRCSAIWDQQQRMNYAFIIAVLTVLTFVGGIALGADRKMSLTEYLLLIGLPSMLVYVQGGAAVKEQLQTARRRDSLSRSIDTLLDAAISGGYEPPAESVRDAQNILYLTRARTGGVPKFVFKRLKKRLDADQEAAASEWRRKILKISLQEV